jgi:hypothetical protein
MTGAAYVHAFAAFIHKPEVAAPAEIVQHESQRLHLLGMQRE